MVGCVLYQPQVRISDKDWIDIGLPVKNFSEAEAQRELFINYPFRVMEKPCFQTSRKKRKGCCGG